MSWDWIVRELAAPAAGLAVGWVAQRFASSSKKQKRDDARSLATALGQRYANYAIGAARMTLVAVRHGHVPADSESIAGAWRDRFANLCQAAGMTTPPDAIKRAAGHVAREWLEQKIEDGAHAALIRSMDRLVTGT